MERVGRDVRRVRYVATLRVNTEGSRLAAADVLDSGEGQSGNVGDYEEERGVNLVT